MRSTAATSLRCVAVFAVLDVPIRVPEEMFRRPRASTGRGLSLLGRMGLAKARCAVTTLVPEHGNGV